MAKKSAVLPAGTVHYISEDASGDAIRNHGKFKQQLIRDIIEKKMDGEEAVAYLDNKGLPEDVSVSLGDMLENCTSTQKALNALAYKNKPYQYRGEEYLVGFASNPVDAAVQFAK